MEKLINEVTFKDFSRLAVARGWTVEMLAEKFHDGIDRPSDFFERVLSCKWKNSSIGRYEDRSGVTIPYRSVLKFYFSESKAGKTGTIGKRRTFEQPNGAIKG